MPTRAEFKELAGTRLREAKALCDQGYYDGACYLAGYVVEMALKARICRIIDLDYPDEGEISKSFKTHDIMVLIRLSGLKKKFDLESEKNANFASNWDLVKGIRSETIRYDPIGSRLQQDALNIINALENPHNGVLTWLKKYY